jgi:hypothetical protein
MWLSCLASIASILQLYSFIRCPRCVTLHHLLTILRHHHLQAIPHHCYTLATIFYSFHFDLAFTSIFVSFSFRYFDFHLFFRQFDLRLLSVPHLDIRLFPLFVTSTFVSFSFRYFGIHLLLFSLFRHSSLTLFVTSTFVFFAFVCVTPSHIRPTVSTVLPFRTSAKRHLAHPLVVPLTKY